MAKRGEAVRALRIGIISSLFGGLFSLVILALFTPILARWAIKFSAVEKFLIIVFALTVIASLSDGKMLLGIFSGVFGILVSLIGIFNDNQQIRLLPNALAMPLRDGFQLLPVLIGLFAFSQLFSEAESGMKQNVIDTDLLSNDQTRKLKLSDFKGQIINLIRSYIIGIVVNRW